MTKLYKDYVWRDGAPYGVGALEKASTLSPEAYKIVTDPYRKRISLEKYVGGQFSTVIYDSALFDFRRLKPEHQNAWRKDILSENENESIALIRDQDDRIIIIETYTFENGRCRKCEASSPHGIAISIQHIYYTALSDPFDGVTLFDPNKKPIMMKKYSLGSDGEFAELISEQWRN